MGDAGVQSGSPVNIVAHVVVDTATAIVLGKSLDWFFPRFADRTNGLLLATEVAAQLSILTLLSQQVGFILGNKVDPTNGLAFVVPAFLASPTLRTNINSLSAMLGNMFRPVTPPAPTSAASEQPPSAGQR